MVIEEEVTARMEAFQRNSGSGFTEREGIPEELVNLFMSKTSSNSSLEEEFGALPPHDYLTFKV